MACKLARTVQYNDTVYAEHGRGIKSATYPLTGFLDYIVVEYVYPVVSVW